MPERRVNPTPLVLRVALAGTGTALASLALFLLAIAASVVFAEEYRGLQNDPCDLPEGLLRTGLPVVAGAGAAAAGPAASGSSIEPCGCSG